MCCLGFVAGAGEGTGVQQENMKLSTCERKAWERHGRGQPVKTA